MKSYEKVRQLREERQWTQEQMASFLGLSPNGYAKIERGETRLTVPRLEQIAEILGIDILELIQTEVTHWNYQVGDHNKHNSDYTVYGHNGDSHLVAEIEKLKLKIQHQNELLNAKETLLAQQARELETVHAALQLYRQNGS